MFVFDTPPSWCVLPLSPLCFCPLFAPLCALFALAGIGGVLDSTWPCVVQWKWRHGSWREPSTLPPISPVRVVWLELAPFAGRLAEV